jgi:hypothetical protein
MKIKVEYISQREGFIVIVTLGFLASIIALFMLFTNRTSNIPEEIIHETTNVNKEEQYMYYI